MDAVAATFLAFALVFFSFGACLTALFTAVSGLAMVAKGRPMDALMQLVLTVLSIVGMVGSYYIVTNLAMLL